MDTHTDIHFTQGNSSQSITTDITVGHEHGRGNVALAKKSIPEDSYISDIHLDIATDTGDIAERKQSSIPTWSQVHPHIQPAGNQIYHKHDCKSSQDASDVTILPAISEETHLSDLPIVPANESGSSVNFDGSEVPTIIRSQEPLLLRLRTTPETNSRDDEERKTDADDVSDPIQMLDTEADRVRDTDVAYLTHKETRGDFDQACEDLASSQLPSSSPPQIFSSSPCGSSQSSLGDTEPSKMADVEPEISESALDCSYVDDAEQVVQDKSHLASEHVHERVTIQVIKQTDSELCFEMDPSPGVESPEPSKKRVAYQSDDPQPTKRLKSGSYLYPPPAPMRATLASQSRQFKKLAAPFRPPSKLLVARDRPTKDVIESAEPNHDKPEAKELSMHVLRPQHRVSDTSRSVTQFKSPLVNRVSSAGTRTIRLTPALQSLERKLQLLKRAVKVKEDNEEEVLTRLAEKWTEAGREVAYEVWDATKDAGSFEEKAVLARRSYGWENTENRNTSWGWDTKCEDASGESHASDSSMTACGADPLDAEEGEEDSFHNTLGTMLRQLGIAPEIFGWDDDKEVFCD